MIEIKEKRKIYVYCPASVVTGGGELLHQLVDFLNHYGECAYIVYIGKNDHKVPNAYSKYNIKVTEFVDDNDSSVVVCGEGFLYLASQYKNAQIILWWLSVDNAYNSELQLQYISLKDVFKWKFRTGLRALKLRLKNKMFFKHLSIRKIRSLNAINAYQSEYARLYLESLGFERLVPLKDYINTEYYQADMINNSVRKPKVLYNPRKGVEFTEKLIAMSPDIQWCPIQNMNRQQILDIFHSSMLYIDFGNHPGKDRLPREAALNGCCIITGRRGAAKNDIDINIPSAYKFDEKTSSKEEIVNRIRFVLNNYEICKKDFYHYKELILSEKEEFENQIIALFNLSK